MTRNVLVRGIAIVEALIEIPDGEEDAATYACNVFTEDMDLSEFKSKNWQARELHLGVGRFEVVKDGQWVDDADATDWCIDDVGGYCFGVPSDEVAE